MPLGRPEGLPDWPFGQGRRFCVLSLIAVAGSLIRSLHDDAAVGRDGIARRPSRNQALVLAASMREGAGLDAGSVRVNAATSHGGASAISPVFSQGARRADEPPPRRCRNVLDHLPERDRASVKQRLRRAWALDDHARALEQLRLAIERDLTARRHPTPRTPRPRRPLPSQRCKRSPQDRRHEIPRDRDIPSSRCWTRSRSNRPWTLGHPRAASRSATLIPGPPWTFPSPSS